MTDLLLIAEEVMVLADSQKIIMATKVDKPHLLEKEKASQIATIDHQVATEVNRAGSQEVAKVTITDEPLPSKREVASLKVIIDHQIATEVNPADSREVAKVTIADEPLLLKREVASLIAKIDHQVATDHQTPTEVSPAGGQGTVKVVRLLKKREVFLNHLNLPVLAKTARDQKVGQKRTLAVNLEATPL